MCVCILILYMCLYNSERCVCQCALIYTIYTSPGTQLKGIFGIEILIFNKGCIKFGPKKHKKFSSIIIILVYIFTTFYHSPSHHAHSTIYRVYLMVSIYVVMQWYISMNFFHQMIYNHKFVIQFYVYLHY